MTQAYSEEKIRVLLITSSDALLLSYRRLTCHCLESLLVNNLKMRFVMSTWQLWLDVYYLVIPAGWEGEKTLASSWFPFGSAWTGPWTKKQKSPSWLLSLSDPFIISLHSSGLAKRLWWSIIQCSSIVLLSGAALFFFFFFFLYIMACFLGTMSWTN